LTAASGLLTSAVGRKAENKQTLPVDAAACT
jgi:hypothetical protein